jgi:hypothetical protein
VFDEARIFIADINDSIKGGFQMIRKDVRSYSSNSIVVLFFVCTLLVLILEGCATTPATTGPGIPDAMQLHHYEMVKTAIEAKSRTEALAALALLQSDVSRWRTNSLVIMQAFVDIAAITDKVDEEDWLKANKLFEELTAAYRNT